MPTPFVLEPLATYTQFAPPRSRPHVEVSPSVPRARSVYFGGQGQIVGTVKQKGSPDQPVHRRVRLIEERSGLVVAERWSNPDTGDYVFDWLDPRLTYTVISYDYTRTFRAVVADHLSPEPMP